MGRRSTVLYLVGAIAVALLVLHRVPYGWYALYPFTLFATWVHECGHALVAVLVGGSCSGLHIYASTGGDALVTRFGSWRDGAVCAGGLLAPPVAASILLVVARGPRRARLVLALAALLVAATTALLVRSIFGGLVLGALALLLGWLALRGAPRLHLFVVQFLAAELGLDWIARIDYFFADVVRGTDSPSDVATLAASTGGLLPYWLWGAILAALSSLAMLLALRFTLHRELPPGQRRV